MRQKINKAYAFLLKQLQSVSIIAYYRTTESLPQESALQSSCIAPPLKHVVSADFQRQNKLDVQTDFSAANASRGT